MLLKLGPTLLCGFLCAMIIQVGCSAKKPIAPLSAPFRLESLNQDSVLLTPAIPEGHPSGEAVQATFHSGISGSAVRTNCSAERGPFRLEQGRNDADFVQVTLPAPERWLRDLEGQAEAVGGDDFEALDAILADIDRLQQEGCFAERNASIREFILQSLPMRPNVNSLNTYGYRAGRSGVDLKPGMRLKIERAYFRPPEAGEEEHDAKNFLGVSTVYFDLELAGESKTRFRQLGAVRYSPESLAHNVQETSRYPGFTSNPQELNYRLLFYTYLVPKEHTLSAAIVGARNPRQLDELDKELRAQTDEGCKNAAAARAAACFEFDGFVALSTLINVELNGKPKFVEWGTKIKDVLPKKSLKSLKIRRQFMNSYSEVNFDPGNPNVLSLALVNGDRLTWSKNSSAPR